MPHISVISDAELTAAQRTEIRALLDAAFDGDFSDDDADHAARGLRVLVYADEEIIGHAALIARSMTIDGRAHSVGYLEGVAVMPALQGKGVGRALLEHTSLLTKERYVIAMLSTGEHAFYEKFGWQRFHGQSYVDENGVILRTSDEDAGLMVLAEHLSWNVAGCQIVCDWRIGDVW